MAQLGGYVGGHYRVDLSTGTSEQMAFSPEILRSFIGGAGLGARILFDMTGPHTDPLGPENVLAFLTGPLTGTPAISSGRHAVIAKSPLTEIWGESDAGGSWGATLKRSGVDGLIFQGAAESPVYLVVSEKGIEIRDAKHLWGLSTLQTDAAIRAELANKAAVATIGPAGEKLSRIAAIMHDGKHSRAAGRCGLGAVMGSKKIKAIAVLGSRRVPVSDPAALKESIKRMAHRIVNKTKNYRSFGTGGGVLTSAALGDLPVKNWSLGEWMHGAEKISGQKMTETILVGRYSCESCIIGCGRNVRIQTGPYRGVDGAGPEYEALAGFGSNCLVDDLGAIAMANQLCNVYGIDVISTANSISFALEAYEKGLIPTELLKGLNLKWGNPQSVLALVHQIGRREGLGEILADGVRKAVDQIGPQAEELAVEVKGLEPAFHDPRALSSIAVGYATHPRGACHRGGTHTMERTPIPELGYEVALDRFATERKGELSAVLHDYYGLFNSLKLCHFILTAVAPSEILGWLNSVTGWDMELSEFLLAGERHTNLKRLYNVRCGMTKDDDRLPERLLTKLTEGGAAGRVPDIGKMLSDYYRQRGWTEDGLPTPEKLRSLGLEREGAAVGIVK